MASSSRLALGTVQPEVDRRPMVWALTEALRRRDVHVQTFLSRASFPPQHTAATASGLRLRYLDSWLMDETLCREFFAHGSRLADLSLVEGTFLGKREDRSEPGGQLETLCEWLRLPRIVLLDASRIAGILPRRPAQVDGVLLDQVADARHFARLATDVQTVWRVPVLGSLPAGLALRGELDAAPAGTAPSAELLAELGNELAKSWNPETIHRLAQSQPLGRVDGALFRSEACTLRLTVAVAFDEAFDRYFPCALDMLESRGATVVDFSPLRDEHLPPGCDIVLLGGGYPERYAATLDDNHCMKTALRNHVRWGRRIYAEGGGAAFLCQLMVTPDGHVARMAGLLPAVAKALESPCDPQPVEATLTRATWLGHAGIRLRGYRNSCWTIEPTGPLAGLLAEPAHCTDMVGGFQSVGSMLEIHFGAQAGMLNHFFYPHRPTPPDVDLWKHE